MATTTPRILLARFEITPEYLGESLVSTLDFPFTSAIAKFIEVLQTQVAEGKKLDFDDLPPYKSLNTVLTAWCPTSTYAFEKQYDRVQGKEIRQMLVFGHDPSLRPSDQQLSEIVDIWARDWVETKFPQFIKTSGGKTAYRDFLAQLQSPEITWHEVDARVLLEDIGSDVSRFNNLGYRAIPAMLASVVAGKSSIINDKARNWWLCREDDTNFIVVSDPYTSAYTDKYGKDHLGTFAYKLEFRLQTQVGRRYPWLHVYVRCRRYVNMPLEDANFGRSINAMIGIGSTKLFTGNGQAPTFITAPIVGGVTGGRWDNDPNKLLTAMQIENLIDPSELFADPAKYREPGAHSKFNEYYLINAEGYDPVHEVKTGLSFKERSEVIAGVAKLLGLEPSKGISLTPDDDIRFTRLGKPLAMFTATEISEKKFIRKTKEMTAEQHNRENQVYKQNLAREALIRAMDKKPLQIYILWSTQDTCEMVNQTLRELLFLDANDAWPLGIQVIFDSVPGHANELVQPLDSGQMNPQDKYLKGRSREVRKQWEADWDKQMRLSARRKSQLWVKYLTNLIL